METYFLIYGNPCDGFNYVGPFEDHDAARRYMESEPHTQNIWIAAMDAPAGDVADDPDYDDNGNLRAGVDN